MYQLTVTNIQTYTNYTNSNINQRLEMFIKIHQFSKTSFIFESAEKLNSSPLPNLQGSRAIVDNVLDAKSVIPYQASYSNLQQCVEALIDSEGVPSLWKGFSALLLQYSCRFAVVHSIRLLLKYIHHFSSKIAAQTDDCLPVTLKSEL